MNLFQPFHTCQVAQIAASLSYAFAGEQAPGSRACTVSHLVCMSTEEADFITSLSQMRKLRLREVLELM